MKILLITDHHLPEGGAEKYFFELKQRLKQTPGMEVYSIGFAPQEGAGQDFYVLKAARSNISKLYWRLMVNRRVYRTLKAKIDAFQPDVIHLHNIKQYPASLFKAIRSYPTVQTIHDFSGVCPTGQNLHQDLQPCHTGLRWRCLLQHRVKFNLPTYLALLPAFFRLRYLQQKNISQFIAPSPLLTDYLIKNNFTTATFIPPFKKDEVDPAFNRIKPCHFLYAGHLGAHKGTRLLLKEFALACQTNQRLMLTIAGTGTELTELKQLTKSLNIESHVQFVGWQPKLDEFYTESIALIFPSTGLESFGLVMTEAMNHARPIIGANRGTIAWLVEDNKTGLLFNPNQPGDLAKAILTLADNPTLAKQLGTQGREKLKTFIDNDRTLQEILKIYQQAASR